VTAVLLVKTIPDPVLSRVPALDGVTPFQTHQLDAASDCKVGDLAAVTNPAQLPRIAIHAGNKSAMANLTAAVTPLAEPVTSVARISIADPLSRARSAAKDAYTPTLTPGGAIAESLASEVHVARALDHLGDGSAGRAIPLIGTVLSPLREDAKHLLPAEEPTHAEAADAEDARPQERAFAHSVLSWDDTHYSAAGVMLQQFERSLRALHDFTNAALKIVAPELAGAR